MTPDFKRFKDINYYLIFKNSFDTMFYVVENDGKIPGMSTKMTNEAKQLINKHKDYGCEIVAVYNHPKVGEIYYREMIRKGAQLIQKTDLFKFGLIASNKSIECENHRDFTEYIIHDRPREEFERNSVMAQPGKLFHGKL